MGVSGCDLVVIAGTGLAETEGEAGLLFVPAVGVMVDCVSLVAGEGVGCCAVVEGGIKREPVDEAGWLLVTVLGVMVGCVGVAAGAVLGFCTTVGGGVSRLAAATGAGRLACGVMILGFCPAVGCAGGVVEAVAVGGATGAPAGGLLALPQRKIRVAISRASPPAPCGAVPTIVIISPVSTACT